MSILDTETWNFQYAELHGNELLELETNNAEMIVLVCPIVNRCK